MSGLREMFDEMVADVPVYGDLDRAIERADRERRHRYGAIAGLAAAAAAVAVIVGVLAVSRDGKDSPQPIGPPTQTPTGQDTAIDPLPRNGQITSAERYLGTDTHGYSWRAVDTVSGIGLVSMESTQDSPDLTDTTDYDFTRWGFEVVGRTGPIATLTCTRGLRCPPDLVYPPSAATLGPGVDEITVEYGYHDFGAHKEAHVIGFDGRVRRTIDLTAVLAGEEVTLQGLRWSPDGSRLALMSIESIGGEGPGVTTISRVWVVNRDGGDAQLGYSAWLNPGGGPPSGPDFNGRGILFPTTNWGWSPDGQTLLLDVEVGPSNRADVVLLHMQPDDAADPVIAQTLYHSNRHLGWSGNVAWSPDGTRIAVRTRDHITEISADDGTVIAQHPPLGEWLIWPAKQGG